MRRGEVGEARAGQARVQGEPQAAYRRCLRGDEGLQSILAATPINAMLDMRKVVKPVFANTARRVEAAPRDEARRDALLPLLAVAPQVGEVHCDAPAARLGRGFRELLRIPTPALLRAEVAAQSPACLPRASASRPQLWLRNVGVKQHHRYRLRKLSCRPHGCGYGCLTSRLLAYDGVGALQRRCGTRLMQTGKAGRCRSLAQGFEEYT